MSDYFHDLYKRERLFKKHGLSQWPTEEEMLMRIFGLEDRVEELEKDITANNCGGGSIG